MTAAASSPAEAEATKGGRGWLIFAGIVLTLAGLSNILNALWSFDHKDTGVDALLYSSSLSGWAWIYLIAGALVTAIGVALFFGAGWAIWAGLFAAGIGVLLNMLWIFAFPIASLVLIGLNLLVVYGLTVHTPATAAFRYREN